MKLSFLSISSQFSFIEQHPSAAVLKYAEDNEERDPSSKKNDMDVRI